VAVDIIMVKVLYPRSDSISAKIVEPSDFESMLNHVRNHIINGLTIAASTGLSVTITSGKATVNGLICDNTTIATISGLTDNTVNYIYIQITRDSGSEAESWDFVVNTTGTTPTDSTFIGKATTSSGSVTTISYTDVNYDPLHISHEYFGDASDGDVTISSGTTTISEIKNYDNLTISSGATLTASADPLLIYVRNNLTIDGTIHMNGFISGGAGGYSSAAGTGGGGSNVGGSYQNGTGATYVAATVGTQGYNGKIPAKGGRSFGNAGSGGTGGDAGGQTWRGGSGGGGTSQQNNAQASYSALDSVFKNAFRFIGASQPLIASGAGGAGGQGAGEGGGGGSGGSAGYQAGNGGNGGTHPSTVSGGAGGNGGGTICIIARNIILNSGSSVTSNGTNGSGGSTGQIGDGANGTSSSLAGAGGGGGGASGSGGGGGAGGGGGLILMIYQNKTDNGGTITVTGGTGGTAGASAARHGNGGTGGTGYSGYAPGSNGSNGGNATGTLGAEDGEDGADGVIIYIPV
jgi:hypothetical protein